MEYEKFKDEVYSILRKLSKPVSWSEIKNESSILNQKAPYHGHVQRLRGDIGLRKVYFEGEELWALQEWFVPHNPVQQRLVEKSNLLSTPKEVTVKLLCKAREQFPRSLKRFTHCLAGVTNLTEKPLIRLYPLSSDAGRNIGKWDIVKFQIKEFWHERRRPESTKIDPDKVQKVGNVEDKEKGKIIRRHLESGEFLHSMAYRGKSLGLIEPEEVKFRVNKDKELEVVYYCDQSNCSGHKARVWDSEIDVHDVDWLNEHFSALKGYFLMGTARYHPNRWMVISILDSDGVI